jgi:hypothetical protein
MAVIANVSENHVGYNHSDDFWNSSAPSISPSTWNADFVFLAMRLLNLKDSRFLGKAYLNVG